MKALLLAWLLCGVTIDGTDWVSSDGIQFLSLRPTRSDSEGTAWYAQKEKDGGLSASTGKYELDNSGPVPAVRLYLSSQWFLYSHGSDEPRWYYDHEYHVNNSLRYGAYAEYELTRRGCDLSVIRTLAIDRDGDLVSRKQNLEDMQHLMPGEVFSLKEGTMPEIENNPPPGFVTRSQWKNRARKTPDTIYRTDLLKQDWYGWSAYGDEYFVLSLREGEEWDAGNARLMATYFNDNDVAMHLVARGRFKIYLNQDADTLLVDLPMTRFYTATGLEGELYWTAHDTSSKATGLRLFVPLDDRSLREGTLTLYAGSTYYVDESGDRERRFNDDGGFLRSRTEKVPETALEVDLGTTFVVRPERLFVGNGRSASVEQSIIQSIESSPPPGLRLRPRKEVQLVAKVIAATDDRPAGPDLNSLIDDGFEAYKRGEYQQSAEAYSKVIEAGLRDAFAYEMRGRCYFYMNKDLAALGDFTSSINLKSTARVYYLRGCTFSRLGEYRTALKDYKEANRLDPKDAGVFNTAAWTWATCPDASVRDGRRAVMAAKKACELSNWDPDYVDTLAAAYAESGDFENAVHFQRLAIRDWKGEEPEAANRRLEGYLRKEPYREP